MEAPLPAAWQANQHQCLAIDTYETDHPSQLHRLIVSYRFSVQYIWIVTALYLQIHRALVIDIDMREPGRHSPLSGWKAVASSCRYLQATQDSLSVLLYVCDKAVTELLPSAHVTFREATAVMAFIDAS